MAYKVTIWCDIWCRRSQIISFKLWPARVEEKKRGFFLKFITLCSVLFCSIRSVSFPSMRVLFLSFFFLFFVLVIVWCRFGFWSAMCVFISIYKRSYSARLMCEFVLATTFFYYAALLSPPKSRHSPSMIFLIVLSILGVLYTTCGVNTLLSSVVCIQGIEKWHTLNTHPVIYIKLSIYYICISQYIPKCIKWYKMRNIKLSNQPKHIKIRSGIRAKRQLSNPLFFIVKQLKIALFIDN